MFVAQSSARTVDRLICARDRLSVAVAPIASRTIRRALAEATYGSYRHHIKDKMAQMGPLWLVQWAAWLVTSDRFAAERVVGELSPTPLLVVHGTADRGVRPYHAERLFAAAADPKDIWRVEDAGHLQVFTDTVARERLVDFFKRSLPAGMVLSPRD